MDEASVYNSDKVRFMEVVEALKEEKRVLEERCRLMERKLRVKV
jgi:hypothetical protein